ncbi:hypothetical protein [Streptomyces sp. R44]|uniref:Uncharacterized protein n=1 Tax=Streptomyces sp. R44 TaxID=3238633 RepID=A0AB39TDA1_9ACTN
MKNGTEQIDGDDVGEPVCADLSQFFGRTNSVQRRPDPLARLVGKDQAPLQQQVTLPLVHGHDLLGSTVHVLECRGDQLDRRGADQLPVAGEAGGFLLQLLQEAQMAESVRAQGVADRYATPCKLAADLQGNLRRLHISDVETPLQHVQERGDVCDALLHRQFCQVLVLRQFGELPAHDLQQFIGRLLHPRPELPGETTEEHFDIRPHRTSLRNAQITRPLSCAAAIGANPSHRPLPTAPNPKSYARPPLAHRRRDRRVRGRSLETHCGRRGGRGGGDHLAQGEGAHA